MEVDKAWEVYQKGWRPIIREGWRKAKKRGVKGKVRFFIGAFLFTLGWVSMRAAEAVFDTMNTISEWVHKHF